MSVESAIEILSLLVVLLPVVLKLFVLMADKSHNIKIRNLAERSQIIVKALEQSGMTNEDKKQAALQKLAIYAKEVGIKVTGQQLDDYIEASVHLIKELNKHR